MKKVISFCLWGNNPKYTVGAIENVYLAQKYYPDWDVWIYIGKSVPSKIVEQLKLLNARLIKMDTEGNWKGMFWRFLPLDDEEVKDVDIFISRDTDSRLGIREKAAVDEWLSSGKKLHIMRDHPHHGTFILGGMWGIRRGLFSSIKDLISKWKQEDRWQTDQEFLRYIIYPIARKKEEIYVHDEFFNFGEENHKFPIERENSDDFIGKPIEL